MEISNTDFSAPIGASVFKFCEHLHIGKVYCLNENKDVNLNFAFFFLLSLLYKTYGLFFCQRFLSNYLTYDSEIWYKA